ncbi:MAG TPA: histidinol dehydrogenase [Candidatus Dormibacteraeota bacterium]|nr:histidinol dehydrogenase [Candidatus Dormibacteraeota bacterium]
MRILRLTTALERKLLAARVQRDAEAERVAARIVADVRKRGDAALAAWTEELDGIDLRRAGVWVSRREIAAARMQVNSEFRQAVRHAARNVKRVATQQLPRSWKVAVELDVTVSQIVRPLDSVGCYIPGGRFALVSSLIMTAVPTKVAGVREIVAVCPKPNAELLAAADLLGVTRVARTGGAQAIAALAYGTRSIPRVEKICGPGNRYVTAAKQLVSSDCAIDLPAGPTEAVVLAVGGNPRWIASDLLAQAEHAPDAGSFLVTTSTKLARQVRDEIIAQLKLLPRQNPAQDSIRGAGAILVASSLGAACDFVNRFAPEHLSLPSSSSSLLQKIHSAGTIFVGMWAAQPLGDYISGSNHVLPTAGWARRRGGLSAADFVKCISVQSIGRQGFRALADDAQAMARAEGLTAHANAIEVRQ